MDKFKVIECMVTAKDVHSTLHADCRPSIDALFLAAYLTHRPSSAARPYAMDRTAPQWFRDAVEKMQPHDAPATDIFMKATGKQNVSNAEARQCGVWLRDMGIKARKSNGRQFFMIGTSCCT